MDYAKKKIVCIIQARMSSTRLPGKSLALINGIPCIERVINRIKKSFLIDEIWLACSTDNSDNVLEDFIKKFDINFFRGSLNDVLSRYVSISEISLADYIVRITGDCPLVDPSIIDDIVSNIVNSKLDYVSNTIDRTYPDGLDVEAFSIKALLEANKNSKSNIMREHVTPYITGKLGDKFASGSFEIKQIKHNIDYSKIRLTLDRKEDLKLLNIIYENLGDYCKWQDVIKFLIKKKHLLNINKHIKYNEKTENLSYE